MNKVKFFRGSAQAWETLKQTPKKINDDTLYFIYENKDSPTGRLYLGEKLISGDGEITVNLDNYYTIEEVNDLIPVDISELNNDVGYLIEHQDISGKADINDVYNKEQINELIPTKVSDLNNDSNFIDSTIAQQIADSSILEAISNISTLRFEIVQEKPVENIENNVIYLIPKENVDEQNIYEEWIYINNDWELIGTTEIDLSDYYTKIQIDNLLNNKQSKIFFGEPIRISVEEGLYAIDDICFYNGCVYKLSDIQKKNNYYIYDWSRKFSFFVGTSSPPNSLSSSTYELKYQRGDFYVKTSFDGSGDNINAIYFCRNTAGNTTQSPLHLSYDWIKLPLFGSTLSDYNINNAYTKTEVNNLIPTVPTNVSSFTNDAGYLTQHQDISSKEDISNKAISLSSSSTNDQYPSAKAVYDAIENISLTPGPQGANGKSAYAIAVEEGFNGTQQEWLTSLVGAAGVQGPQGIQGIQGETGPQGPQGVQGETGATGAQGATGPAGASAYEVAVENGFVGTEQQWLASLVGATGQTGAQGPAGANGADWIPTEQELNNIAQRALNLLPDSEEVAY